MMKPLNPKLADQFFQRHLPLCGAFSGIFLPSPYCRPIDAHHFKRTLHLLSIEPITVVRPKTSIVQLIGNLAQRRSKLPRARKLHDDPADIP